MKHIVPPLALVTLASLASAQDPCGTWSVVPAAAPANSDHTVLQDVAVVAPNDAWAVGTKLVSAGTSVETQTLAYRWNGASWAIVPTPSPTPFPGGGWAELNDVEALASNDVWAAGGAVVPSPSGFVGLQLMVQHWNGAQWSLVPAPVTNEGSGNFVAGIEAIAPDDIWFVGDWLTFPPTSVARKEALTMHWNGSQFEVIPAPFFDNDTIGGHGLEAVSAVSSNDVWAVGGGHDGDYVSFSYIVHWDGSQWTYRPGFAPGYWNRLYDVEAVAANDVYVVGDYQDETGYHGLFMHWNGASWTRLPNPPVGGSSIEVVASDRVYIGGAGVALWDGASFTIVAMFPEVSSPSVLALETAGPCAMWGVGRHIQDELVPLTVRLDPSTAMSTYCTATVNSTGAGAHIGAMGSASISAHQLTLFASGAPAFRRGLFFYGNQQTSSPFGNGVQCAGGQLVRSGVVYTSASGNAMQTFQFTGSPVTPGSTWNVQFMYRDPLAGGAQFNATNGLAVHFAP